MIEIKQQSEKTLYIQCIDTLNICQGNKVIHIEYKTSPHLIPRLIEFSGVFNDKADLIMKGMLNAERAIEYIDNNYHLIPKADKKEAE